MVHFGSLSVLSNGHLPALWLFLCGCADTGCWVREWTFVPLICCSTGVEFLLNIPTWGRVYKVIVVGGNDGSLQSVQLGKLQFVFPGGFCLFVYNATSSSLMSHRCVVWQFPLSFNIKMVAIVQYSRKVPSWERLTKWIQSWNLLSEYRMTHLRHQ